MPITYAEIQRLLKKFPSVDDQQDDKSLHNHLKAARAATRTIAEGVARTLIKPVPLFQVPGEKILSLYLGYSLSLQRYKIGVAIDCAKREKSLNASLLQVGLEQDFEIFSSSTGFEDTVRLMETKTKTLLKHHRLRGEWYDPFYKNPAVINDSFDLCAKFIREDYELRLEHYNFDSVQKQISEGSSMINSHQTIPALEIYELRKLALEWEWYYKKCMELKGNPEEKEICNEL